jgi:hypothetical protein
MPRTPKSTDGEAPKPRTRKAAVTPADGTNVVNAAKAVPKTAKPKVVKAKIEEVAAAPVQKAAQQTTPAPSPVFTMQSLEERVRMRAYELYLRRGGQGGSPEQDWFQAMSEVYGESVA